MRQALRRLAIDGDGVGPLERRREDDEGHRRGAAGVADEVRPSARDEHHVAGVDRALLGIDGQRRRTTQHDDGEIVAFVNVRRLSFPDLHQVMAHRSAAPELDREHVGPRNQRIGREKRVEIGADRRQRVVQKGVWRFAACPRASDDGDHARNGQGRHEEVDEETDSGTATTAGAAAGLDLRARFRHNARAHLRRASRPFGPRAACGRSAAPQATIVSQSASTLPKREVIWLLALLLHAACSGDTPETIAPGATHPPTARMDIVRALKEDLDARRHPADGGGSAWLEDSAAEPVQVSTPGRWTIVYEAGPLGIAVGGALFVQPSPFWGWSSPHVVAPNDFGFTELGTDAPGVQLEPKSLANDLLAVEIAGRALAPGERIRLTYGAGPRGAIADRYAERGSRLWLAVDGDGDGVRALVPDSPRLDVRAGPPARLQLVLPTTARPGAEVRVVVAVLDATGSTGVDVSGAVRFVEVPAGIDIPEMVRLDPGMGGRATLSARVREPGLYRLHAVGPGDLRAESNPLEVSTSGPRVLWGDLHGHSNYSDGTGLPEDYFVYARDVAALDVASLTDHDHWGMQFIDRHPELWGDIRVQTARFHEPHRFVTLLGYEWTSWI